MRACVGGLLLLLSGCTAVTVAQAPTARGGRDIFITSGDLKEPYESVGLLQVTRRGVRIFGAGDPAGTDLDAGLRDAMLQIHQMGGDGMINTRWHQTQYTALGKVLSIFALGVLPGEVTITGEVVRLRRNQGAPPPRPGNL
jgi:hypothetical protein